MQEPTTLSDGSAIEFTVGRYLTPSGRSIDGVGIVPDVTVPASAADSVGLARGRSTCCAVSRRAVARAVVGTWLMTRETGRKMVAQNRRRGTTTTSRTCSRPASC